MFQYALFFLLCCILMFDRSRKASGHFCITHVWEQFFLLNIVFVYKLKMQLKCYLSSKIWLDYLKSMELHFDMVWVYIYKLYGSCQYANMYMLLTFENIIWNTTNSINYYHTQTDIISKQDKFIFHFFV